MKNGKLIAKLSESLTLEEIAVMAELNKALLLVDETDFDDEKKKLLKEKINTLIQDTANHAKIVAGIIKDVANSDEKEY